MQNKFTFTKLIVLYFFLTHLVAGLLYENLDLQILEDHYNPVYFSTGVVGSCLWAILTALFLDLIFSHKFSIKNNKNSSLDNTQSKVKRINHTMSLLIKFVSTSSFIFGIYASIYLDRAFRYSEFGISESDSFLMTLVLGTIPGVLTVLLFYNIFICNYFIRLKKIYSFMFIAAYFLNSSGNATTLNGLLAFTFLLFPSITEKLLFKTGDTNYFSLFIKLPLVVVSLFLMVFFARFFGENIKRSSATFEVHEDLLIRDRSEMIVFKEWIIMRISMFYVSTKTCMYYLSQDINFFPFGEYLSQFFQNIWFRITVFMGISGALKPALASPSNVNFYWISPEYYDRAGTSPGLIAGFFYYFPTPINLITMSAYLAFIYKIFTQFIIALRGSLSIIGLLFFLYWLFPFFESPIDLFMILDNSSIVFMLFLFLAYQSYYTVRYEQTYI